jgi:hypothetical protein
MKNRCLSFIVTNLVLVAMLISCRSSNIKHSIPHIGTTAWYQEVGYKSGVIDEEGHGPDPGSTEWLEAVSRKLKVYDDEGHGPDLDSREWKHCVHRKVFNAEPR